MSNFNSFEPFEPLKNNRFVINVVGTDIPGYLFTSYRIHNQDKTMVVETEFYETVDWAFNPQEFFDIKDLIIQNINAVGDVVSTLDFSVKEIFYEKNCSYHDDGFVINRLKFITDNCELIMNKKESDK